MTDKPTETSKFLSYILRHEPQAIGLTLDSEGWANIEQLISASRAAGREIDLDLIQCAVSSSDKKRFVLSDDNLRIRAAQGHSTASVRIDHAERTPPTVLYHGTAVRFLDSILANGLSPGARHHVHLSEHPLAASTVGQRHGKPAVLEVDSRKMHELGFKFFQAENGVWLTNSVPREFLTLQLSV